MHAMNTLKSKYYLYYHQAKIMHNGNVVLGDI